MFKNNKWKLIVSSLIILLPIFVGVLLWERLPVQMSTHWGSNGEVDGKSPALMAVVGLPVILLAFHWLALLITSKDPGQKDQNKKALGMIFWIMPGVSLFANGVIYATALGWTLNVVACMPLLLGLVFVLIGNYMPKCKPNYTLGVRVKWTLENTENWNATHRFCGKVWVFGGVALWLCIFLPKAWVMPVSVALILPMAFAPLIYSYVYHRKQVAAGLVCDEKRPLTKMEKTGRWITACILPMVLVLVAVLMFTGDVKVTYEETSFTVDCSFWSALTVDYDTVESVEYREGVEKGHRVNGVGSARLQAGMFENEEFGSYTLYSYTGCKAAVVIRTKEAVLVIGGKDARETRAIYEQLTERSVEK